MDDIKRKVEDEPSCVHEKNNVNCDPSFHAQTLLFRILIPLNCENIIFTHLALH